MESRVSKNNAQYIPSLQGVCQTLLVLAVGLLVAGCSGRYDDMPASWSVPSGEYEKTAIGRFKTGYLVDQIDNFYKGVSPGPIGVTTLVNLDDLYETSSFGRVYSEHLMSELVMRGYDVVELRHADALRFLSAGGEFGLSRELGAVRASQQLGSVLVGTYEVSPERVYINARLINPSTSMILSAGSVEMSKTKEIAKLLRGGGIPVAMERIPVKHLTSGAIPLMAVPTQGKLYDWEETSGPYAARPEATLPSAPRFIEPDTKKGAAKK